MVIKTKISRALCSPKFFWVILALFSIESSWMAISAAYPMVFDENTHLGIIRLHAEQWSPIFTHQPPHSGFAGALTRDPSYLYHYMFSFPYRLLTHITSSQMALVITLRFINIMLFGVALILFRKLLLKTRASPAIVHVTLLLFILVPVVPLLAGQINYDNLVLPITALTLLLAINLSDALGKRRLVPIGQLITLFTVALAGCLVKVEFLPVLAALFLYMAWRIWNGSRSRRLAIIKSIKTGWHTNSWRRKLIIGAPFIVAASLFIQMYGVNLVSYRSLVVPCGHVLSTSECSLNGTWLRNHTATLHKTPVSPDPLSFAASWLYRMFISLFYTSSGGASPKAYYLSINPLPVPFFTALIVFAVGCLAFLWQWRKLFIKYDYLGLLLFVAIFYGLVLWLHNFLGFQALGQKFGINGRYILPVAPILVLIIALAYREALARHEEIGLALAAIVLVLLLQGGGIITYITVSNQYWYWKKSYVVRINRIAHSFVSPLVIDKTPLPSTDKL